MQKNKWFFIVLGLIFFDQVSKFLILRLFPEIVVYNKGIAFGFLPSACWLVINLFILLAVAYLIKRKVPAILIISGGISNLLDRLFRGAVVDFIDLKVLLGARSFSIVPPLFNLADIFICLGAGIMILLFCGRTKNYFSR